KTFPRTRSPTVLNIRPQSTPGRARYSSASPSSRAWAASRSGCFVIPPLWHPPPTIPKVHPRDSCELAASSPIARPIRTNRGGGGGRRGRRVGGRWRGGRRVGGEGRKGHREVTTG